MANEDRTFALDVGTRTVVGLVLKNSGGTLEIEASAVEEHKDRAMLDGQIHDIPLVAGAVARVKERIEEEVGYRIERAAVAAAGRALITGRATLSHDISSLNGISSEILLAMQLATVQEAQKALLAEDKRVADYHCVGYSVVRQILDGVLISNPLEQFGDQLEIEVIATFLPRMVVDSLHAVLKKVGLEMECLTLEPIAASQVVIPPSMRRLNVALVDVGAGTSDIAISREGSFCGYEMVDMAGDEISEELSNQLIIDFSESERIKKLLAVDQEITYKNILGIEETKSSGEIRQLLTATIRRLAQRIGEKIITLNGELPQAVMLIGGGSLTPGLVRELAATLDLPAERVGIRGREVVTEVIGELPSLESPQAVTPLGIAVAGRQYSTAFQYVFVNNRPVRVFQQQRLTVAEALLAAGIPLKRLMGKPGPALAVEVNGTVKFFPGEAPKPAEIQVNGEIADLRSAVSQGDEIAFQGAQDGKPAHGMIRDVVQPPSKAITFNGTQETISSWPVISGKQGTWSYSLEDNMVIQYNPLETVGDILTYFGWQLGKDDMIEVNNRPAELSSAIRNGDALFIKKKSEKDNAEIFFNGQRITLTGKNLIYTDVFGVVQVDARPPAGKKEVFLKINGEKATFTTPIKSGDRLTMEWK